MRMMKIVKLALIMIIMVFIRNLFMVNNFQFYIKKLIFIQNYNIFWTCNQVVSNYPILRAYTVRFKGPI